MPRENRNNDISRFRAALQELENGSEEGVPMLNLTFTLDTPGFADGVYRVRAKGFLAAALWWAAAGKALADWSAFAYISVAPSGDGVFPFPRERALPPGGTPIVRPGGPPHPPAPQATALPHPILSGSLPHVVL